jgi:predicted kinase
MNVVYFMIGIPGSGKSTFARQLQKDHDVKLYVCPDDIRERLTGSPENFTREGQVWDLVKMQLAYAARTKNAIILDATGANYKLRRQMVRWLNSLGSRVYGFYVKVSLGDAILRNARRGHLGGRYVPEHVIVKMYESLTNYPPTRFDGFYDVTEI